MTATLTSLLEQRFPDAILGVHQYRGQETVLIKREALLPVAGFLREAPAAGFDVLMDITCVDYLKFGKTLSSAPTLATPSPLPYAMKPAPSTETWDRLLSNETYRFDVIYHYYSTRHNHRLRLKVPLTSGEPSLDSLTGLWTSAGWFEREVWDMFGVQFVGHPDLRRLLMYEGFQGHPLRKDYPVSRRQPLIGPVN